MKKLLAILTIIILISCNKQDTQTTQDTNNYQLRLQVVDQNGDTTYSETKVIR